MAKRERPTGDPAGVPYSKAVEAVRSYYNSDDARRVYETAYGDEHLHLGIYENDDDTIDEAGQRTMERMASMVRQLGPSTRVLDIGSGHGGSALAQCGAEYIERIKTGLGHWVDGGKRGYLQWGILHLRKG